MIRAVVFDLGQVLASPPDIHSHPAGLLGVATDDFAAGYWTGRQAYDEGGSDADYWGPLLSGLGRRLRPDRVITFDPWKRYEVHPDHVTAGRMACEAAVFSCFPLLHPGHLDGDCDAHQPREVWFMGPLDHKPNRVVDITNTLEKKVEATLRHGSQLEMLADWFVKGADPRRLTDADRAQLHAGTTSFLDGMGRGVALGLGGKVEIAEAFYALKTGPGHFDNQQTMIMEMLGMPPEDPTYE